MSKPTVIVTGASGALGAATAIRLAEMGADVVITARRPAPLQQTAAQVQNAGARVLSVVGDLTEAATINTLVEQTVTTFGKLDAIVNNAGILAIQPIANETLATWRNVFEVNVLTALALTQAALPHLRETKGRVVNVSSGAAVKGYPTWGAYGASKAAMNHLTMTLASEEPNIIPIAVRPGVVDTDMQALIREQGVGVMPPEQHARFVNLHRDGDLIPPETSGQSLAALALFMPDDWRGRFVSWNDDDVRGLIP